MNSGGVLPSSRKKLGNAVAIAQVDPEEGAFVADALHPAAEGNVFSGVCKPQFAASVGSEHISVGFCLRREINKKPAAGIVLVWNG